MHVQSLNAAADVTGAADVSVTANPSRDTEAEETEPREECGVFGVWAPGEDVSKLTYFGLFALQHLSLIHI